jgi:hypothetical protein
MPPIDAAAVPADLDLTCPRCQAPVTVRFYGPCETCRAELRVVFAGEARDVEVEEYVPKMNVTPNAVASRE